MAARLKGWSTSRTPDRQRAELEANGEIALIAANRWDVPGTIGFYAPVIPRCTRSG